jgi:folate-dependent phosphoribosylglycinamide formyltransferase PurN
MICQEEKFLTKNKINNTELNIRTVRRGSTVYIVKIKLDNGQILTQKGNLLMVSIVIYSTLF